jgi:hypothetical protein
MDTRHAETCQVCRGDGYALAGGFWGGGAAQVYYLFLPLIRR